jgi:hypothetical protein
MKTHAPKIAGLFARQEGLLKQLIMLNGQLYRAVANGGASSSAEQRASRGAKARRSWFVRGEAPKLMKRLAKKPMAQADLVRALSAAKGYDKGLSSGDKKRFQSAAYQAIANAVAGKKLVLGRDGSVRARA